MFLLDGEEAAGEESAEGGEARPLDPDSRGVYAGVQAAGDRLIARWESSAVPAEIVRLDTAGGHQAVSRFNADRLADVDLQPFREFWFESSSGRRVHSWLALPPDFDESRKYPLVLQIHGGPFASSMDSSDSATAASMKPQVFTTTRSASRYSGLIS